MRIQMRRPRRRRRGSHGSREDTCLWACCRHALWRVNLEAFGSQEIRSAVRELLDQLNWRYAIGSLGFRRFPPFRRQYVHATDTDLDGDRHVALIKTWISLLPGCSTDLVLTQSRHIAIWACWSRTGCRIKRRAEFLDKPEFGRSLIAIATYAWRFTHAPISVWST